MRNPILYLLAILLSMITFTACGILPHGDKESLNPQSFRATKQKIKHNTLPAQEQARRLLSKKDYVGTIALIQKEIGKGVGEELLSIEYLQAANACLSQADTFMKDEHYQDAALLLRTVQDSYPGSYKLQQQVSASLSQVKVKIDACTEKLMEAGLIAYRSGELATAVSIWQQVLVYQPQRQEARNAIQTTERQMSKLNAMIN